VPLDLEFDGGSGSARLELGGLRLRSLRLECGSGSCRVDLPVSSTAYTVEYDGGSGSLELALATNTDATLRLSGGSGSLNLRLPAGSAARLEVEDNGSGSVNVPSSLVRLSGRSNEDSGVWETSNYGSAAHKVLIILEDLGSGSFNIN
jgi:hypothetical protein